MKNKIKIKRRMGWLWKLLLVLGLGVTITGTTTLAYFTSETASVKNTFETSYVNVAVLQDGNATIYEDNAGGRSNILDVVDTNNLNNYSVLNKDTSDYPTGNTFVRVRLVPICRGTDGNGTGIEVEVGFAGDTHWEQRNDGYWYYDDSLAPNETTSEFDITSTGNLPVGCTLEVQILVDGVQAYIENFDYADPWEF